MPEGPSIVILKELTVQFKKKKILEAYGNTTKIDFERLKGKTITDIKSWGKHYLICFPGFFIRVHFLLFGSYRVNEKKDSSPRLHLQFKNGELNLYACSIQLFEKDPVEVYDWTADTLSPLFDHKKAIKKLKAIPKTLACDAILDQNIFAGAGNIFKNEVLFRIKVHPLSKLGKLPTKQMKALVDETVNYAYDFLKWKKAYVLKKNWLAHTKRTCPRCEIPLIKKHLGKTNRRSFFCNNCQKLFK
jgi:endonuclease-8